MDRCQWKLVNSNEFTFGVSADRCGILAQIKIIRPHRKTDLALCEEHFNEFVKIWGLSHQIKILCRCPDDGNQANSIDWGNIPPAPLVVDPHLLTDLITSSTKLSKGPKCTDADCKKCLQDGFKTWWHK